MSAILLDNGIIHYEVFGRGKPVLLLHGWLGSWRYWMPTMEALADSYRTYAMDFWGYGDSDKPGNCYGVEDYVRMVGDFLDGLGIAQAALIGHALGGVVALRIALERPQRVTKLAVIDAPIHGGGLSSAMRAVRSPLSRLMAGPRALTGQWLRALKRVSSEWGDLYDDIAKDTEKLDQAAVQQSLANMVEMDLRPGLKQLYTHTLVVFGEKDEFVSADQAAFFTDGNVATAQVVVLEGCRHFPFLDEPSRFNRLLKDFLGSEIGQVVALKEEWKRRYKQAEFL